ncbi:MULTISPECIES: hypothetical protein [unclassified Leifsonia]|uniref:hypothetical protein n=1 Tax=unclassified Leifsonia TaxID=2663824 RepID=UPI0006FE895D|nr:MULTISPECIES: hypothetical protein [unclassified Leifsonia]KQX08120.1 hypothetical protein ASC59_10615 [Leifsonia sp. Root1293]KRA12401.1 hypothetical protein ASD61_10615 [Leifsonia sp. Root60]
MTTRIATRATLAAIAGFALLALSACSSAGSGSDISPAPESSASSSTAAAEPIGDCTGVAVIVDAGNLESADDPSTTACIDADAPIAASEALKQADVATVGTDEYADQVVCRVNGVPAEDEAITAPDGTDYFEKCASMPAAFAYWSLWVKPADGEWAYAQEGLGTLQLAPGDSVELLFTLNDEPAAPAA